MCDMICQKKVKAKTLHSDIWCVTLCDSNYLQQHSKLGIYFELKNSKLKTPKFLYTLSIICLHVYKQTQKCKKRTEPFVVNNFVCM